MEHLVMIMDNINQPGFTWVLPETRPLIQLKSINVVHETWQTTYDLSEADFRSIESFV